MKLLLILASIFVFTIVGFGQAKKAITKPAPKPIAESSTIVKETKNEIPAPTQKVVIEKLNGDKITGLFVSGDANLITIEISSAKVPINLNEIKAIWIGEAKPEPPVPVIDYVGNAIKALKQLSAATEVGVNFQDYGRRVIDVKAEVEENLSNISDENVRNEIKLAMEAYVDASSAWNEMLRYEFILVKETLGQALQKKYSIPIDNSLGSAVMWRKTVLSSIWQAAKTHIENATKGKP